jgi:hypothetical protein
MSISRLMQMGAAGSLSMPVAIDDADIDIGTRIDAGQTAYSGSLNITANSACVFIVRRSKAISPSGDNSSATLTVGSTSATKIASYDITVPSPYVNHHEVYYLENVSTGSTVSAVTGSGNAAVAISISAFMLDSAVQPTVTNGKQNYSFNTSTSPSPKTVSVSVSRNAFIWHAHASDNYLITASTTLSVSQSIAPIGIARSGNTATNVDVQASNIQTETTTVTATLPHNNNTYAQGYDTDYLILQF